MKKLLNMLFKEQAPPPPVINKSGDYLVDRLDHLLRLRPHAQAIASATRDMSKLAQCDRLIRMVTDKLNNRPTYFNQFNYN